MTEKELAKTAINMRKRAYAPYSGFFVGAALLGSSGTVYTGCNIENASFSPTICAERTAFAKAVSEGEKSFQMIAIAGGKKEDIKEHICVPCGVCLQVMAEFCHPDQFGIILVKNEYEYEKYFLKELLPHGFSMLNN